MGAKENKAIIQRFWDAVTSGDQAALGELLSPDYARHDLSEQGGDIEGEAGVWDYMDSLNAAFPEISWTLEQMVAEGDRVAVRYTMEATQQGEFLGIQPTGRPVHAAAHAIMRIADGKIAENWFVADWAAFSRG